MQTNYRQYFLYWVSDVEGLILLVFSPIFLYWPVRQEHRTATIQKSPVENKVSIPIDLENDGYKSFHVLNATEVTENKYKPHTDRILTFYGIDISIVWHYLQTFNSYLYHFPSSLFYLYPHFQSHYMYFSIVLHTSSISKLRNLMKKQI